MSDLLSRFKTKKTRRAVLAAVALAGIILALVLDVWLLGTLAAKIHGLSVWFSGFNYFATDAQKEAAKHAFDGVTWYWHHPFATVWAWLTKPSSQLANPGVRTILLFENILLIIAVAVILILIPRLKEYKETHDRDIRKIRFKQIDFNAEKEIEHTPAGQVFLGLDDRRQPVYVPVEKLVEHVHVLGGSGTGKTSFAVVPICIQAIRYGLPVVAVDFKGDKQAIQLLAREAKKAGKKFYLFSLHPGVKSNTYNPLNSGTSLSRVERILTALELVFQGEARFYTYCQQAVFIPLLKHFDAIGVKYTMRDVREILRDPDLVGDITGEEMTPGQVKGMTAALTPYADMRRINDPEPDIDLGRSIKAGDVVYFDLQSAEAPQLASAIGKMIAMDLQAQAAQRTQRDQLAVIAIDEFQNMACQAFRNIISKVRSANYALILANQALGDLNAVSKDFLNTVVTNTATKIVFNVEGPADAEYFARRSGQVVISSYGRSTSRDAKHPLAQTTYGESSQDYDKYNVHANVFLKLPFGKSVIFRRGELAVLSNHAHLISKAEKDLFEMSPYPEAELGQKRGVRKASEEIERRKREILERKRREQEQNQGRGQPRQRPGQVENACVGLEDFTM